MEYENVSRGVGSWLLLLASNSRFISRFISVLIDRNLVSPGKPGGTGSLGLYGSRVLGKRRHTSTKVGLHVLSVRISICVHQRSFQRPACSFCKHELCSVAAA